MRNGKRLLERLLRHALVLRREDERPRLAGEKREGIVVELAANVPGVDPHVKRRTIDGQPCAERPLHRIFGDFRLDFRVAVGSDASLRPSLRTS